MNKQIEFFNAGDELPQLSNCIWLIINGVIKSYTINDSSQEIILGFWGKQDIVGYTLTNVKPYFLECMSNVEAITIFSDQWNTIHPNLLARIKQLQQISYVVRHPQSDRLWLFLRWLAQKFGQENSVGTLINFPLTSQELADALGMKKIIIEAQLIQLEQQKLIAQQNNRYTLLP